MVVEESDANRLIEMAGVYGIEGRISGIITQESEQVLQIDSKFPGGEMLTYRPQNH